jgi:hypothetical protein
MVTRKLSMTIVAPTLAARGISIRAAKLAGVGTPPLTPPSGEALPWVKIG